MRAFPVTTEGLRAVVLRHELAHAAAIITLCPDAPLQLNLKVSERSLFACVSWRTPPPSEACLRAQMLVALCGPYYSARLNSRHPCGEARDFEDAAKYAMLLARADRSTGSLDLKARAALAEGRELAKAMVDVFWRGGTIERAAERVESTAGGGDAPIVLRDLMLRILFKDIS